MFCAACIVKSDDKSNCLYIGYGITFDGVGSWSFVNYYAWNVLTFGVVCSSSSYTDNCEDDFLVLCEGPTDDINGSVNSAEKKFSIIFSK